MPVDVLRATEKDENTYVFSSKKVLKVGEDGQLIGGGSDGSNEVLDSDSQLNRAAVGGGSIIRPNREFDLPEGNIFAEEDNSDDSEIVSFDDDFFSNDDNVSDDLNEFLRAKEEASI